MKLYFMDSEQNQVYLRDPPTLMRDRFPFKDFGVFYKSDLNLYRPMPIYRDRSLDGLVTYQKTNFDQFGEVL